MLNKVTCVAALSRTLANRVEQARGPDCFKMFYMSTRSIGVDAKN